MAFYCVLHGWHSIDFPCPACHQTITTTDITQLPMDKFRGNLKDDHGRIIFEISESGKYIVEEYKGEEKVLPRTEVPVKDWEILSLVDKQGGKPSDKKNGDRFLWSGDSEPHWYSYDQAVQDGCVIHSVKRLSDNTIWVTDEITAHGKIKSFQVNRNGLEVFYYTEGLSDNIIHVMKLPPTSHLPEDKKPVLFTEDEIRTMIQAIRDGAMGYDTRKFLNGRLHEMIQAKKQSSPLPESKDERIMVTDIDCHLPNDPTLVISLTKMVEKEKFNAIKSAVERELNNESIEELISGNKKLMSELMPNIYTQEQLDAARERAFNAAREVGNILTSGSHNYVPPFYAKFPTLVDYLKSIQP